ncbi:MAG: winged helix-turn-helix transcriptional regulator [Candidatus Micrarchaeia archaeon]
MKFGTDLQLAILGSPAKVKIMGFLLTDGRQVSENELAQRVGFSQPAVNKALRQLGDLNLIERNKMGNSYVWSLRRQSYAYDAILTLREFFQKPRMPLDYLMETLRRGFGETAVASHAYLIGSVATGHESGKSDVDVLIITRDAKGKSLAQEQAARMHNEVYEKFNALLSVSVVSSAGAEKNPWMKKEEGKIRLW